MLRKLSLLIYFFLPIICLGAGGGYGGDYHLDGSLANMGIIWVVPFAGILLSIAIFPLVLPDFWHHNFGKISLFWASILIIPFVIKEGIGVTLYELLHVGLLEYVPFIILLLALFTISGGVRLTGALVGTPIVNLAIILIGTFLASWMGTTGAAMLLIRPLINANKHRKNIVHIIVFFIFLVANIGGSLTPLGDPPLFLGFLKGVDFFWTTTAMFVPMLIMIIALSIIFYFLDSYYLKKEDIKVEASKEKLKLGIEGVFNLGLIVGVIGAVLISGFWKPHISFEVYSGVHLELQNLTRDILLLILTYTSWTYTPQQIRKDNEYTWFPIIEVAKLFAGIFVTIIPAIAILKAGTNGALAGIINAVSSNNGPVNIMYFWYTGVLSSFLDNAPTYLVFFNTAGGDPITLMGELKNTLLAISAGAVFMGANTYIGNAPNFMVKSIAESSGVEMPSFFGYLFKWSIPFLVPLFIIVSWIFFA
tara:strand:+ start:243 stop:1673 length:1431 start_codon:yes stop_codon:yes gene_type:complete